MGEYLHDEDIIAKWEEILNEHYLLHIKDIESRYPDNRSLYIRFSDVDEGDPDFATGLLRDPDRYISLSETALRRLLPGYWGQYDSVNVRIIGLPRDAYVNIRDIRAKHLNTLIAVEGMIRKATEVRPKMLAGLFICERCHSKQMVRQDFMFFKEPLMCVNAPGSCNKSATRFTLDEKQSIYVDTQKIELQESPEGLRGGAQPEKIVCYLEDDLAGRVTPGNRVILIGTVRSMQRTKNDRTTVFEKHFEVLSVEFEEFEYEDMEISPEDEREIRALAEGGDGLSKIVNSVAPSIFGLETEKEAITLQLFGGTHKEMDDGSTMRGDIHILLVGDPGVAKSQLLRYMSGLAPRGIFASGKSATGAGLTAAAVKDDFGDGRWTLEAGAMVLADQGLACIDELDKMSPQDRSALHEAMESQKISIAKAGITATLQCRCSMLAAANPKHGRFEPKASITSQIDLPPPLLSRFDMIFVLSDLPNKELDTDIAHHILSSHKRGEARKKRKEHSDDSRIDEVLSETAHIAPKISADFIRKYIAYSKRVTPMLTDDALKLIEANYIAIRAQSREGTIPITARQLEAYVRLAEASARARLSEDATVEDAERAIRIVTYYLSKIAGTEEGLWDIDRLTSSTTQKERNIFNHIRGVISVEGGAEGVLDALIIMDCEDNGFTASECKDALKKMERNQEIYSPRFGYYKLV